MLSLVFCSCTLILLSRSSGTPRWKGQHIRKKLLEEKTRRNLSLFTISLITMITSATEDLSPRQLPPQVGYFKMNNGGKVGSILIQFPKVTNGGKLDNILTSYHKVINGGKWDNVFNQVPIGKRTPHSSPYETIISRDPGHELRSLAWPTPLYLSATATFTFNKSVICLLIVWVLLNSFLGHQGPGPQLDTLMITLRLLCCFLFIYPTWNS